MQVCLYPEKAKAELGAVRYLTSWEQVRESALNNEEIDIDEDVINLCKGFDTRDAAVAFAKTLLLGGKLAFGQVSVTKQEVDWFVREDNVGEWADRGELEYFDMSDVA